MKILITSGGRLATLLYHALCDQHELRILRRKPDPAFGQACVVGDVSNYHDVASAMQDCQIVFHTAVRNNDDVELKNYEQFLGANVDGTFNVCLAAVRLNVQRVVLSSTSMVNGFHEAASNMKPGAGSAKCYDDFAPPISTDIYGLTKNLAEQTADYFQKKYHLSIISLRYGWLAPLKMYRDLAMVYNTLQFCFHENDALAANLLVMDQKTVGNYLITAKQSFTDEDAVDLWQNPKAVLQRHYPNELDYLLSQGFTPAPIPAWLDCSRACNDLGYQPQFNFDQFIQMHKHKRHF